MKFRWGCSIALLLVLPFVVVFAQDEEDPHPEPGELNNVIELFQTPFEGDFTLANYFDHDLPFQFNDSNESQLNHKGEKVFNGIRGHAGHDWLMPIGTPMLAVADGRVDFAQADNPFFCPILNQTVTDQNFIQLRHTAPNGEIYASVYVHLDRMDVSPGDTVEAGQVIGLSGNKGCSTQPHLHFHVWSFQNTNNGSVIRIDPYGWEAEGEDPWAEHPDGASSRWLWKEGAAPRLIEAPWLLK